MPDESDERDAHEDVDDVDASDPPEEPGEGTDSGRSDDTTDSTPDSSDEARAPPDAVADEPQDAGDEPLDDPGGRDDTDAPGAATEADDATGSDANPDADDHEDEPELGDDDTDGLEADDGDAGGLQPDDDDDSGGLQKIESEGDRARRPDGHPEGERPDDEGPSSPPDRGVEAGFDRPEDAPDDAKAAGPGPGPRPHPDRTNGGSSGSDVPVGHAAGAPNPGEATPAGAGGGGGGATAGGYDPGDDDMFEGPPDDEEMPLADHIEEMVLRLAAVVTVGAVATALVFLVSDTLVQIMWDGVIPGGSRTGSRPHLYGPLEFVLTKVKVASLAGILLALPILVYQSYLFMRPGLYPKERKYYLAAVPTSLVLATVGMAFAYFAVLPGLFQYFDYYTRGSAIVAYGLAPTFNLIVALMGLLAVVFQIPLFVMLAIMMGVTTREWLEQRRLLFWGAFAGIAFLFAPDPTGMAPFIIAVTMIVLFEGTLLLLRWTGR